MIPTLTLAQIRKFSPCEDSYDRVVAILPKRGPVNAAQARDLGCTYGDIIWAATKAATSDDATSRRLTGYLNDNAKAVLHIFERAAPDDDRVRNCIAATDAFLAGEVSEEDWKRAAGAAWDARAARAARAAWDARDARAAWAAWAAWAARAAGDAGAARAARAAGDAGVARAAGAAGDAGDAQAAFEAWQFDRLIYWLTWPAPVALPMPEKGSPALPEIEGFATEKVA